MDHHPTSPHPSGPGWPADLTGPEEFFCCLEQLETDARSGRRPVTRRTVLAAALLGLTGLSAAGAFLASTCTLCYAVTPQGDPPLAYVRQAETYVQAVSQVEEQVSAILHTDYAYPQDTQVALAIAPKESLQTPDQLTESLMETVDQVREVWVLTVDGVAAGACAARETVDRALTLAQGAYTTETTQSVTLVSQVAAEGAYLPVDTPLLTAEELAQVLLQPREAGETDPDQAPGDPLLVVETVSEVTETQAIPCPVQEQETDTLILGQTATLTEGIPGQASVTARVTYRCGVEVGRETLTSTTLTEPTPTILGIGTAQGADAAQGRFLWPTTGQITSPFGTRYIFGSYSFHQGLDIANAAGTDILAAAGGTVTWSAPKGTYGNLLKVDHGNGFVTYYAHCSELLVTEGDQVAQGQPIARMGSTGRSTGPHLHFEVRWQDQPIDPERCLP